MARGGSRASGGGGRASAARSSAGGRSAARSSSNTSRSSSAPTRSITKSAPRPAAKPAPKPAPMCPPQVYSLNLEGGKKYIGKVNAGPVIGNTTPLDRRLNQHFSGTGAQWTQKNAPVSVNHVQTCRTNETASRAETIVYERMRDYHGLDKVRGAGHTKST